MTYSYLPTGVCPAKITFDLDGDVVTNIQFYGGCPGNLKAISKLANGFTVQQILDYFEGNTCGARPTSCVDQLSKAVRAAYEASRNNA